MPICHRCNAKVLRTDAFCGTCGEPVPGAKPVVPIARSGTHEAPERLSGSFPREAGSGASARALAAVALSEPEPVEADAAPVHETAIRERERPESEPAPVVLLHRKKDPSLGDDEVAARPEDEDEPRGSSSERETSLQNIPAPAAPPILASDLLREQMRPASPGATMLRAVTVSLSVAGAAGVFVLGGWEPLTFVSAALLVMMGTLALTPISYRARAVSLCLVGCVAASVALWQQVVHQVAPEGVILALATIVLSGSLLFRAYYRGARLARFVVALGVTILAAWFVVSRGHESLVALEGDWRSWAPAVTHVTFGLLGLLSLMAFMETSTRGGSHVWAFSLLGLYAIHVSLWIASELFPSGGGGPSLAGPTVAALVTGAVGTIVAGLALAQVFVTFSRSNRARPTG